jgi:hypothetical protein
METKYPEVEVQLTGRDGNAFYILGAVQREMRRAGIDQEAIAAYMEEAQSGDYDNLLRVTMRTVTVL